MPGLIIGKTFAWRVFRRLPACFQTATAAFAEKRDQAPHLLIFLRSKTRLKPAESPIDSFHRLPCFLTGVAGRSTSSDIELVTTFSGETNWSSITTGLRVVLVGMTVVSNRSNRRVRFLPIIFVVSVVRPVISPPPIPAPLRRRTLPPRRTQPA